ncbi:hypothetical protein J7L65_00110 [Candidatus Bathyarchaeota archaeon]|nr:hypothetical protein [Candidatus Bathyarchaeota archaeon]
MTPDPSKIHRCLLEREEVRACRAIKTNAERREYIHQELLQEADLIIIL